MKTKLGSTILASLFYVQGVLAMAAVAAVLVKEPAKEHHAPAQSAAGYRGAGGTMPRSGMMVWLVALGACAGDDGAGGDDTDAGTGDVLSCHLPAGEVSEFEQCVEAGRG